MKKGILFLAGVLYCFIAAHAQGEIDLQPKVFYRNEWSVAVMLNSNGIGGNYRYGKRIDAANKRLFEIDFAYLKDPKEKKYFSQYSDRGTKYTEGKKNLALDFRFAYGKQHEIYRKHDAGGIAIRWFYNFGPSVVLLKPIYYDLIKLEPVPGEPGWVSPVPQDEPEKYDSRWQINNELRIAGRGPFLKGFDEISAVPGVFGKIGFNFEFGKQDRIIHALEAGLIAEGFIKRVEIMDFTNPDISQGSNVAKNQQFFFTLFVSYRFGRIVDPYEIKKKRERSREISY